MSLEALVPLAVTSVMALIHAAIVVAGIMLVKSARSWAVVFLIAAGVIIFSVALSSAGFLLQGSERAASILLPGGEMFPFVFMPIVINAVISTVTIMCVVYSLFVEPGNQKHV
jgi:hypothetical protein